MEKGFDEGGFIAIVLGVSDLTAINLDCSPLPFKVILCRKALSARRVLWINWLLAQVGDARSLSIPRMGDLVLIDLGDGVLTRREPHNSHELHQTFQLYNYRSDTEHGMLVKPSVPPFKTRMPPCSSPFICRFRQIGFAVKSHGSHKKSKSSS